MQWMEFSILVWVHLDLLHLQRDSVQRCAEFGVSAWEGICNLGMLHFLHLNSDCMTTGCHCTTRVSLSHLSGSPACCTVSSFRYNDHPLAPELSFN